MKNALILVFVFAVTFASTCHEWSPTTPTILASFDWSQVTGTYKLRFINTSTGGKGVNNKLFWRFGDGGTSNERDPIHNYGQSGDWVASLTTCPSNDFTSVKCDVSSQPVSVE